MALHRMCGFLQEIQVIDKGIVSNFRVRGAWPGLTGVWKDSAAMRMDVRRRMLGYHRGGDLD